ncbi:MAG: anthranilate phosphoribosyltransferase [Deltaproteobacteria bacterium]|nr:anthranilate phosphoribosyltransferase [Deltaproteobacteria bacterium]
MRDLLERLFAHQTLSREEAREALANLFQGSLSAAQAAAFLAVFRMRPLAVAELVGFRDAMMERAVRVDLGDIGAIDLCGTGGDGKSSFNISTLAALVVAACGVPVAKHGNYAVSSSCGSSNVLEKLGVRFTADPAAIKRQLQECGICFMHAPLFHPSMKAIAPVRKELGVKTFFNLLGPLANPASPRVQLCGVYNLEIMRLYSYAAPEIGKRLTIIHSLDGYDEISLTSAFKVLTPEGETVYQPEQLEFARLGEDELKSGPDIEGSARIFTDVLQGRGTAAQNSVVTANAAFALHAARFANSGTAELSLCIEECKEALVSGRTAALFAKFLQHQ